MSHRQLGKQVPLKAIWMSAIAAAALTACGGGGITGSTFQGKVLDGYLSGAVVCVDLGRDGACSPDDPQAMTGVDGGFTLSVPDGLDNAGHEFLVEVLPTSIDSDSPQQPVGKGYQLKAAFDHRDIISPLSTVVAAHVAAGLSLSDAKAKTIADLKLPSDFQFSEDYVSATNKNAHNAARVLARLLQANDANEGILSIVQSHRVAIQAAAQTSDAYTDEQINSVATFVPEIPMSSAVAPEITTDRISIYGDVYGNLTGVELNPSWGQKTKFRELSLFADHIVQLSELNYQGIQFPVQDVSLLNVLHMNIWSQKDGSIKFKLVTSAAQQPDIGKASESESTINLSAGWNSVSLPLAGLSGPNLSKIDQMVFVSDTVTEIALDNIFFWDDPDLVTGPSDAAPQPRDLTSSLVTSVFSDAYIDLTGTNFAPYWGQQAWVAPAVVADSAGGSIYELSNLSYQGIQFGSPVDVTDRDALHVDLWSSGAGSVGLSLISPGTGVEKRKVLPLKFGWNSFDIPLSYFSDIVDLSQIIQFKWDELTTETKTIYYDNLYFYSDSSRPYESPLTVIPSDADVIYSNLAGPGTGVNINPYWGQATLVSEISTGVGHSVKLANLNYQGIDFASNPRIVANSTSVHVDIWSPDEATVNFYLISEGPAEKSKQLTLASGWNSIDIPASYFADVVNLSKIIQFKWDGLSGVNSSVSDIYYDNLYFK